MTDLVLVAGLYLLRPGRAGHRAGGRRRPRRWCCTAGSAASSWRSTWPSTPWPAAWPTTVFAVLGRATALSGAWDWVAALAAVAVSTFTACACIFAVMRVVRGLPDARASCPACSALSLPFALGVGGRRACSPRTTAAQNPAALVLLALPVRPAHRRLPRLHQGPRAAEQPAAAARGHLAALQQRRRPDGADRLPRPPSAARSGPSSAELVLFGEADATAHPEPQPRGRGAGRAAAARATARTPTRLRRLGRPRPARSPPAPAPGAAPQLDRYAARHALKDAMVVGAAHRGPGAGAAAGRRPARRRRHLRRQRPRAAGDLRPARGDLAGARPPGDRPPPGHRAPGAAAARGACTTR